MRPRRVDDQRTRPHRTRLLELILLLLVLATSVAPVAAQHTYPGQPKPLPEDTEPPLTENEATSPLFDRRPNTEGEARPGRRSLEELATTGFEPGPLERRLQSHLPLFKNLAGRFADRLPLPLGFDVTYVKQWNKQLFTSNEVTFNDTTLDIPSSDFSLLDTSSSNVVGILDAWVLPFMNIYGVGGYTTGELEFTVSVPQLGNASAPVKRKYHGYTVGGGAVLGGAYNQMFLLCDITYVTTGLNIFNNNIETFVVAPRFGVEHVLGPLKGTISVGANWYRQSSLRSSTFNVAGRDLDIRFRVEEKNPWNGAAALRVVLFHRFDVAISGGFGTRKSFMARAGIRF